MNYYDAYLRDTIQTGNLTVNVGLRFDYQQGKNLPSTVSANPVFPDLLPAVQYGGDSGYPITWRTDPAARGSDVRAGTGSEDAGACLLFAVRQPARR